MLRRSLLLLGLGIAVTLSGCAQSTPLSGGASTSKGSYNDNGITELAPGARGKPVSFSGPLDSGGRYDSSTALGGPLVVNFWYAGCPPCRAEAPDLKAISLEYQPHGVGFIGIDVRDEAPTALQFSQRFGISYPSILDADSGAVQLAFSGSIAPNAVPTTLVLDRQGRVSARIIGRIPSRSTLTALIDTVLEETS